jgi:hypothetical protein
MSSTVITCFLTVLLTFTTTNVVNTPKVSPAPIQISWRSNRGEICVFNVRAAPAGRVKVQLLTSSKDLGTETKVWDGGIDSLLAVTERASAEAVKAQNTPDKSDLWRKLTIRYIRGGVRRSFSIEGHIDELFRFFSNTVDLKALLTLVSGDAPKAYRLLFLDGPLRSTMQVPSKP